MSQPLNKDQFRIVCPGSSKLYVDDIRKNPDYEDGLDLVLGGGTIIPDNKDAYQVFIGSTNEQEVVKIEGRVLTIIIS